MPEPEPVPDAPFAALVPSATAAVPAPPPATKIDPFQLVQSFDLYVTVLVVVTVVTMLKHTVKTINPALLAKPVTQVAFEWAGPLIAVLLALAPGLWDQYAFPVNVFVAIPCGFLAERLYKTVLARVLPGLMLAGPDAAVPHGNNLAGKAGTTLADSRELPPAPPPAPGEAPAPAPAPDPAPDPDPAPAPAPDPAPDPDPAPEDPSIDPAAAERTITKVPDGESA
jgi:hypothetical protein